MSECIDKDCMRAGSADAGSCADCQCVWLEQECEELRAERDRLRDALTPSAETKAAYMGEFSIQVTDAYEDDDGEFAEYIRRVLIPWDAIKEIMAAIRARAALKGDTPSWENLRGVAPDATGDLSSEAFIRQQRDEWDSPPALKGDTP